MFDKVSHFHNHCFNSFIYVLCVSACIWSSMLIILIHAPANPETNVPNTPTLIYLNYVKPGIVINYRLHNLEFKLFKL